MANSTLLFRKGKMEVLEHDDDSFSIYSFEENTMGASLSKTTDCFAACEASVFIRPFVFRYSKDCPFKQPRNLTPLYGSNPCARHLLPYPYLPALD